MAEFFYRTEDIKPDEVLQYFVETRRDREIVNALCGRNAVILAGSRGIGKSFLLRVAEAEMQQSLHKARVLPVYITFNRSSLIHTSNPQQFQNWMLARICSRLARAVMTGGLDAVVPRTVSIITGEGVSTLPGQSKVERIATAFEESWKTPGVAIDLSGLPSVEVFRDAIEDIVGSLGLDRIVLLIDEAAHILIPEQQRQFFTLFRDLRSPYLSCKAAVYPGLTAYGDSFQPFHDATMMSLDRDILAAEYVPNMREIVEKQASSTLIGDIATHGQNFGVLAFAANGNPRVMLKTLGRAPKVNATQTNEVIREYYRSDIWSEHSVLPDKYAGHRHLIDWGRQFIEGEVLPELQRKNQQYLEANQPTSAFFWVHRDAPQPVKEALRLLSYTGIVTEHAPGIKATRGEVGTRYVVNLGCLFALEATPAAVAFKIAKNLSPKRMTEYGANHGSYQRLLDNVPTFIEPSMADVLRQQLEKGVDVLDITNWQREKLVELGLSTIGDLLRATETKLQEIAYVGEKRSRRIKNAALAAVFEYLSG